MARKLGSDTITVLRAPLVVNPRGKTRRRDWAAAQAQQIKWCNIQDQVSQGDVEDNRAREYFESFKTMWLPANAPEILHTDMIVHNGVLYAVVGPAKEWKRLFRGRHHWEVDLKQSQ